MQEDEWDKKEDEKEIRVSFGVWTAYIPNNTLAMRYVLSIAKGDVGIIEWKGHSPLPKNSGDQ
jgi:hypothetical protein